MTAPANELAERWKAASRPFYGARLSKTDLRHIADSMKHAALGLFPAMCLVQVGVTSSKTIAVDVQHPLTHLIGFFDPFDGKFTIEEDDRTDQPRRFTDNISIEWI